MVPLQTIVGFITWGYGTKNQIMYFQRSHYKLLHVKCCFLKNGLVKLHTLSPISTPKSNTFE
jgi:hypothetical protein